MLSIELSKQNLQMKTFNDIDYMADTASQLIGSPLDLLKRLDNAASSDVVPFQVPVEK